MIDISADRLEGLRTQCATSAELTQHEIRTLEVSIDIKKLDDKALASNIFTQGILSTYDL